MIRQAVSFVKRRRNLANEIRHKEAAHSDQPVGAATPTGGDTSVKFRNYVLWGIIGTAAVGTAVFLGWKFATDKISNLENKGSLDNEDPAYYAKQFKIGFDNNNWYGSDTATIRETMLAIPSKDFFEKVAQSYQRQYKASLFKDLESKLKSTEYQEMQAIYRIKPQKSGGTNAAPIYDPYAWATRIHSAVYYETMGLFWGTDLEAIKQVIREITTQAHWNDLKAAYQAKYSVAIEDDLDGDVSASEYDFRQQLQRKNIAV
jgi:hypothetical protein